MLEIANRDLESVISLFGDLGTDIVRRSDARLLHVPRLEAARQPEVNDFRVIVAVKEDILCCAKGRKRERES